MLLALLSTMLSGFGFIFTKTKGEKLRYLALSLLMFFTSACLGNLFYPIASLDAQKWFFAFCMFVGAFFTADRSFTSYLFIIPGIAAFPIGINGYSPLTYLAFFSITCLPYCFIGMRAIAEKYKRQIAVTASIFFTLLGFFALV